MEPVGSACKAEVDRRDVKNRAMVMAIRTGEMPDVDLIWAVQRYEGNEECFGQPGYCRERKTCRWGSECGQLAEVDGSWRSGALGVAQIEFESAEAELVKSEAGGEPVLAPIVQVTLPRPRPTRVPPAATIEKVLSPMEAAR